MSAMSKIDLVLLNGILSCGWWNIDRVDAVQLVSYRYCTEIPILGGGNEQTFCLSEPSTELFHVFVK